MPRCIPSNFWINEDFGTLSIHQRYLFLGLTFIAEDNGHIHYDTRCIANTLHLNDRIAIRDNLLVLQQAELISTFEADLVINNWWYFLGVDEADKLRREIYERDSYACVYCGGPPQHLDHIQPKSRGGKDSLSNLVTSCQSCNMDKKAQTWFKWYRRQEFYDWTREEYIARVQTRIDLMANSIW